MSLATSSHRAALLRVLLLVLLIAQNLVKSQLTPAPAQRCHRFHRFGEMCYKEAKFSNPMAECESGEHHCEVQLIQLNTFHYVARCSHSCEGGNETGLSPCLLANSSAPSPGPCSLQCGSGSPLCLEKVCATFSCQGKECFKGQKAVAMCPEGLDVCELKRSSLGYTADCSQACVAGIHRCYRAVVQSYSQECCQASASGSCLHLDGSLHFNRAASRATGSPRHWSLAGAMLLLLHSALLP